MLFYFSVTVHMIYVYFFEWFLNGMPRLTANEVGILMVDGSVASILG
jgi:hypothetical protein